MIYTNNYNYPPELVTAVKEIQSDYDFVEDENSISVTTLVGDSPHIRALRLAHREEQTTDVSEAIWSVFGSAWHQIMERSAAPNDLVEQRIEWEFDALGRKIRLSGKFDILRTETGTLEDWKTTSKYSVKGGKWKHDWEAQLNVLRYIIELLDWDIKVHHLKINAVLRDFNNKDKFDPQMPDRNFVQINIPVWDNERTKRYIWDRFKDIFLGDKEECTSDDKWQKNDIAIYNRNGDRKRAVKVFDEDGEVEAFAYVMQKGIDKYVAVERSKPPARCEAYCTVKNFCKDYLFNLEEHDKD